MMEAGRITLPKGYRLAYYDSIDSTNAEASRLAGQGEAGGLWLWATQQQGGKGRSGRPWVSLPGNLYTSLLIRPRIPLTTSMQLPLLAGVAIHEAIRMLAGDRLDLKLKWPNDILIGTAKFGGVLIERGNSGTTPGEPPIIIGMGLNLAHKPDISDRAVTSLAEHGVDVSPAMVLQSLAERFADWLERWRHGDAFPAIRNAWLERAHPIGHTLSVHLGKDKVSGSFHGLDESGALRLALPDGKERIITAGDVSMNTGA